MHLWIKADPSDFNIYLAEVWIFFFLKVLVKTLCDHLAIVAFFVHQLHSKQLVKRSSHEWINKFIIANLISVIISIIRLSDE